MSALVSVDVGSQVSGKISVLNADYNSPVKLRAVTGSANVPTIRVDTIEVGDLLMNDSKLPVLNDALGGADGVLGNEGLADRRVYIDFRHDLIIISRSPFLGRRSELAHCCLAKSALERRGDGGPRHAVRHKNSRDLTFRARLTSPAQHTV